MSEKNCCFKGRGRIATVDYAKIIAALAGFVPAGNAPSLAINITENVERVPDYTTVNGGTHCTVRQIEMAQVTMTLMCHSAEVLALSLYSQGTTGNVAAAAVTGELHVAWPGAIVPLHDFPDVSQTITVAPATGSTTYTRGTDYDITESGSLIILEGSTIPAPSVTDGEGAVNIKVTYQRAEQSVLQLFTKPSNPVSVHFDGVNAVDGRPAQFRLYKVKFGPATSVTVIGDNMSRLEMTGEILRDESISAGFGANRFSQYGTLRI